MSRFSRIFDKKIKKAKPKVRRGFFDLLSEQFSEWISDGSFIKKDKLSSVSIQASYDRIFTKGYIRKSYVLLEIPTYFEAYLIELVRQEMYKLNKDCKTIVITDHTTVNIPVRSRTFKSILRTSQKKYDNYEKALNMLGREASVTGETVYVNGRSIHISKEKLFKFEDDLKSCEYVYEHTVSGGTFTQATIVIDCIAPNEESLANYKQNLYNVLSSCGIQYKELRRRYGLMFESFGIAGRKTKETPKMPTVLMSDQNTAAIMSVATDGLVGGGPILIGQEIKTHGPLTLDFFRSGKGQMSMILGDTGCGKTYSAFQLEASLINYNVSVSVIDIKGEEHARAEALNLKPARIAMDVGSGQFVNTLRLDDYEVDDDEEAKEIYDGAVKGSAILLKLLCTTKEDNIPDLDIVNILTDTVIKLYNTNGVYKDFKESFARTKNLKYKDILPILSEMLTSTTYTDKQREAGNLAYSRLASFFSNEGRYADIFKEELTLKEVIDSDFTIYEFNKNRDMTMDIIDTARVYMVQFLETKRQYHRKKLGLYSALFIEEVQRCEKSEELINYISDIVSGGRSNNVIVVLLLNSISVFKNSGLETALSNISSYFIGHLKKMDIKTLVEDYGMDEIEDMLYDVGEDGKYIHTFVAKFDLGYTSGKALYRIKFPEKYHLRLKTVDNKEVDE